MMIIAKIPVQVIIRLYILYKNKIHFIKEQKKNFNSKINLDVITTSTCYTRKLDSIYIDDLKMMFNPREFEM